MGNGGETFDEMIARVQSRRELGMAKNNFGGKQAPPFGKKGDKSKPLAKSAPVQKSLRGGRR